MQRAYHHYNFELSLIKVRQGNIEPMRFSHALLDKSEISHLIYLNGRPSEYLKLDDQIASSRPDTSPTPWPVLGCRVCGQPF